MSYTVKLQHTDIRPNGKIRVRRRFPKELQEEIGATQFQITLKNNEGAKLQIEYEAVMREFDGIVLEAQERQSGSNSLSPMARWQDALLRAEPERA